MVSWPGVKKNSDSWDDIEDFTTMINIDTIARALFKSLRTCNHQQEELNVQQS